MEPNGLPLASHVIRVKRGRNVKIILCYVGTLRSLSAIDKDVDAVRRTFWRFMEAHVPTHPSLPSDAKELAEELMKMVLEYILELFGSVHVWTRFVIVEVHA